MDIIVTNVKNREGKRLKVAFIGIIADSKYEMRIKENFGK